MKVYDRRYHLLSKGENAFYQALRHVLPPDFQACPKVRVADTITFKVATATPFDYEKVAKRHVDFLIIENWTTHIRAVIELDDKFHNSAKMKPRDDFINAVFNQANVPIIRIKCQQAYDVEELRSKIKPFTKPWKISG